MPMIVGISVALVVVLVLVLNRGAAAPASAGQTPAKQEGAVPTAEVPAAAAKIRLGAAKAGKAPTAPAPTLTEATLQELSDLLARIKTLRNESVSARTGGGDNQSARAKMGEAKLLCEQWIQKCKAPLQWQEQAQMDDWAQPAEYATLEHLYASYQRLENEVRRGGG